MNLNKVLLVGRLTRDVELKKTPSGTSVASFGLATNRKWKDKDGQQKEETEFHNCVAWGRTAELISSFMKKGSEIYVEGRLATRSWEDKAGGKRYMTEVVVENMQFGHNPNGSVKKEVQEGGFDESEEVIKMDDIPY